MQTIFVTVIRQEPREGAMNAQLHGLTKSNQNNALNESAARGICLKFLIPAKKIVGAGLYCTLLIRICISSTATDTSILHTLNYLPLLVKIFYFWALRYQSKLS